MDAVELTKADILKTLRDCQAELTGLGVRSVGVFGSFARGCASAQSDIDIMVEFDAGKKTFDAFMDTCFLLEDTFARRVDVVTADALSPHVRPNVMKEIEYVLLGS